MEQALPKVLGILGGLGPMATVYFYEMLTRHTQAARDQDHIDVIINSRATTPDRTSYILGQSAENPFDIMAADAARLVTFGADVIAIPCNTAHYFYDRLNETIPIPILNMVEETVLAAKAGGSARVGILATTGTVRTRTYQRMCEKHGLPCAVPDDAAQAAVMDIIYGDIKQGRPANMDAFERAAASLRAPSFRSSNATRGWALFIWTPWRCLPETRSSRSAKRPSASTEARPTPPLFAPRPCSAANRR